MPTAARTVTRLKPERSINSRSLGKRPPRGSRCWMIWAFSASASWVLAGTLPRDIRRSAASRSSLTDVIRRIKTSYTHHVKRACAVAAEEGQP
ncbi:Uncharacterised protein [Mycobacterium tuberculosis]|nr:Uncharacterised protein [Mycobacterium tuberculosis]